MVIEEEKVISDYIIQHSGVKNMKHGVRRFQSYAVAPTRSGMVGEEVGEAAEQRQRIEEKKYDDEHEDRREQQKVPEQPKKKTFREAIKERKKAKWARNQKSLYRHRKHYTTQELKDHMYRLGIEERLKGNIGEATENTTRRAMNTLKNISGAALAGVGIYNTVAQIVNTMNQGTGKKVAPTVDTKNFKWGKTKSGNNNTSNSDSTIKFTTSKEFKKPKNPTFKTFKKGNTSGHKPKSHNKPKPKPTPTKHAPTLDLGNNLSNFTKTVMNSGTAGVYSPKYTFVKPTKHTRLKRYNFHHDAFISDTMNYLAHFGVKGQKKGHRYHQSYDTVPTRSGMVGIEHFQKTETENNESSAESQVEQLEKAGYNVERYDDAIQVSKFINHDSEIGTFVSARFREDTLNEKTVAKNIQNTELFLDGNDEKLKKNIKERIIHDILIGDIPEPEILKSSSGKEKGKYVREHVGSQFTGYIMASPNEVVMITDDGGMFGGVFACKVNPYTGKPIGYVQWDIRL